MSALRRLRTLLALLCVVASAATALAIAPAPAAAAGGVPQGWLDGVAVSSSRILFRGWAFDPDSSGAIAVRIYVNDRFVHGQMASLDRPDVGAVHPGRTRHGFHFSIPRQNGNVCVYAINVGPGTHRLLACRGIGLPPPPPPPSMPTGYLEAAYRSDTGLRLRGWAVDADRLGDPMTVRFYTEAGFVTGAQASLSRPDVDRAVRGAGPRSGFEVYLPIDAKVTARVCVYAINQREPHPIIGCAWQNSDGAWQRTPPVQFAGLPPGSGFGRRIVYSNSRQRVWMVEASGVVVDSYPVSGRAGVPRPGTYAVFSKSPLAYAGHDGITMRNMVRFAHGNRLSIGFHAIPRYSNGSPLQSEGELGSFRSAGCVRQADAKASALYAWSPIGTTVVVTS